MKTWNYTNFYNLCNYKKEARKNMFYVFACLKMFFYKKYYKSFIIEFNFIKLLYQSNTNQCYKTNIISKNGDDDWFEFNPYSLFLGLT